MNTLACLILAASSLAGLIFKGGDSFFYVTIFLIGCSFICNAIEKGNKK